jgi:hypothetical protein
MTGRRTADRDSLTQPNLGSSYLEKLLKNADERDGSILRSFSASFNTSIVIPLCVSHFFSLNFGKFSQAVMYLVKLSLGTFWSTSLLWLILLLPAWQSPTLVLAWENCSFTEGGGSCPDGSTCCPTSQSPGISACVPTAHSTLPGTSTKTGQCCGDGTTGCPFGYQCTERDSQQQQQNGSFHQICAPTNQTLTDDPWARVVPRYQLCRVPATMQQLHKFPIPASPNSQRFPPCTDVHHHCYDQEEDDQEDWFHLGYYSSLGDITTTTNNHLLRSHQHVETVVIVIHGSLRDADDYFCTGLSLLNVGHGQSNNETDDQVLILAPWFPTISDDIPASSLSDTTTTTSATTPAAERPHQLLVWDDVVQAYNSFFWHVWRYGADANNAPISSFTALDSMVEYLVTATERFPKLQQIVVAGHSGKNKHGAIYPFLLWKDSALFLSLSLIGWCGHSFSHF